MSAAAFDLFATCPRGMEGLLAAEIPDQVAIRVHANHKPGLRLR